MNQVNITGNITHTLELKQSKEDTKYTQFTLAVHDYNGKEEKTNFIDVVAFGRQAEVLTEYTTKGQKLFVMGRLINEQYTNKEGLKLNRYKVIAQNFEFIGAYHSPALENEELKEEA